jgi:hypothetical protein
MFEKLYWDGEPVDEMTREQLLEVIRELSRALERSCAAHSKTLEQWEACREARKL